MSKRPKSREETPKEGSDSARRYRTATICDRAAQSARVFHPYPMQISQGLHACNTWVSRRIHHVFHEVNEVVGGGLREIRVISRFRDLNRNPKFTSRKARLGIQNTRGNPAIPVRGE
jgi:hypothetical protein